MKASILAVVLLLIGSKVSAEEQFGIKVYSNVKKDASTEWYCGKMPGETEKMALMAKAQIKASAACYRTSDTFKKVVEFYQQHPGIKAVSVDDKGPSKTAIFCKNGIECAAIGVGIDVTVTQPWADAKLSQKDVLILIRKSVKK
jgi:hypothetical protein